VLANAVRWWMIQRRRTTGYAIDRDDGTTRDTLRRLPYTHGLTKDGVIRRPLYFSRITPTQAEMVGVTSDARSAYRDYLARNRHPNSGRWAEHDLDEWKLVPYVGARTKNMNGGAVLTSICIVPEYTTGKAPSKLPLARLSFVPADLTGAQMEQHMEKSLLPDALHSVPQQSSYA
jgi:hypothetical protein